MKNDDALVTVIMGVYNSYEKKELIRSLNSIKNQSFTQWKCIICDDASIDDTFEFLEKFIDNDKRFTLIKNELNMGLGYSLNKALEKVKTKYVIRQDADDYSSEDRFQKLYDYMENHKNIDVLGSGMILFDKKGKWGSYKIRSYSIKKDDFLLGTVVAHPSVIMKTESLRNNGGYRISWETRRCEDYDLFMRMFKNKCNIANIDDELYFYFSNREGTKRKFINVIKECVVRYKGFKNLGMGAKKWIYIAKPLIVYLFPNRLLKKLK